MADIFISYSHTDVDFIRDMVPLLEREGFSVWWDHTIPPGKTWDDVIAKGIKEAKACIIVWSPLSAASDWVKEEATLAKQGGKYLPVQIGSGEPPIGFRRIQAANLQTWNGNVKDAQWRLLITEVARLVKGEPVEGSAPVPATAAVSAAARPGITVSRSVLIGVAVALVILTGGLIGWHGLGNSASPASAAYQGAQPGYSAGAMAQGGVATVVGVWNGKWHYTTDPPHTDNWMKGTFMADGTVIGETSAGTRVAQWTQSAGDVRWVFSGFNYVGKVTGNRLSGTFVGPDRAGVFEATR